MLMCLSLTVTISAVNVNDWIQISAVHVRLKSVNVFTRLLNWMQSSASTVHLSSDAPTRPA